MATVNGTAALQVALTLCGVCPGDEVLIPSLTFVATANAVRHCGGIPHLVDVEPRRLGVDADRLDDHLSGILKHTPAGPVSRQTGRPVRVLCVMHCLGHPADLDALEDVCRRHHLVLVEDAAESLGSWYKDEHTGCRGRMAAVSFNGNKIISTGGGGALLTNDDDLADRARHLTSTGKVPHPWEFIHDQVAWNYRMPNINAALGCAQLELLPRLLSAKRALADRYRLLFADCDGVTFLTEPPECRSNYWLNAILLSESAADQRDELLRRLNESGIQARPLWHPMHRLPMYADCPRADLEVTEDLCRRIINIPSSAHLAPDWKTESV